ncbi:MAG TPA: VacJ family lipoprotein [Steroidobacteraceae bacterium]|nr:VacJ family lipoprotein [Steroidobacteraceae bacterium]
MQSSSNSIAAFALTALATLVLLAGCAAPPAHKDPRDPLERINRPLFKFDDAVARDVAVPFGHGYEHVVPGFARAGIAHFFENLHTPAIMVNDVLQWKLEAGATDFGRFLMNTVVGLGGLFDPATAAGLAKNDNDFGRTLGTWGLPPGPYLVLPFLGPSDLRDGFGMVPDSYLNPQHYINDSRQPGLFYGLYGLNLVNTIDVDLIPAYNLLNSQNVFDRYAFARNAYLQRRQFLISGQAGGVSQDELELEKSLQDDSETPAPSRTPAAPAPGTQPAPATPPGPTTPQSPQTPRQH